MPIFRYQCPKCGSNFELLLARFDSPAACPECGNTELQRAPNLIGGINSNSAGGCRAKDDCPAAGSHVCGGGCCCHKH